MEYISKSPFIRTILALFVILLAVGTRTTLFQTPSANTGESLKHLDLADLDKWELLIGNGTLSNDGKWLAYAVRKNSRELETRLHDLSSGKVTTEKEGGSYRFSEDSKWFGFVISPDAKTQDDLRKDKKPIPRKLALTDLATRETTFVNEIDSFEFSGDGRFVAIKKAAPAESKTANVIVRELVTGKDHAFGNVKEFKWSERGSLLAIATELPERLGNSLTLFNGANQTITVLDSKQSSYSGITWRRESEDLAVLRSFENKEFDGVSHEIAVWRDLGRSSTTPVIFTPSTQANFPKNTKLGERAAIRWSADGKGIFFDTEAWGKKVEKPSDKKPEAAPPTETKTKDVSPKLPEIPAVEIWNASDVTPITEQKATTAADGKLAVWHIETNRFVPLEDDRLEIRFQNDSPILIGFDKKPYEFEGMFGRPSGDVYSVNTHTGERKKLLTNNSASISNAVSPDGRYFVYVKGNHLWLYEFATAKDRNLTATIDDTFVDLDDDHPVNQKSPYASLGWDAKGEYFVSSSKYDVWKFDASSGKATNLTNGKKQGIEQRIERARTAERYIDLNQPYFVRKFDEVDKKSGYSYHEQGKTRDIFWGDGSAQFPVKARNAETIAIRLEGYNDSPDIFVLEPGNSSLKQISNVNPFEKDYKSGKAEIVEYTNAKGQKLRGSLYYPDDFKPGQKYPMITYIYELLSNGFHRHTLPSNTSYYNRRVFTSQGYFVFMPDILFEPGDPGVSSVKTLEAAVKAVVAKGDVDEKRVGLVGHSWGGYQAAYAVTGTNIFAAVVAGAGISNLVTMYGTMTPAFGGQFESKHFEVGQERMMVPPWKDMDGYLRNSSIANISKMQTPLLMEVGDADRNVNWGQAHEMYNAARREKKPMVLLVYANEGHGLTDPKNQIDYQKRILEWFGHYLKKEPAKRWITDNIPYKEQQDLLKSRELE